MAQLRLRRAPYSEDRQQTWLAPVWAELAAAIADYPFDPDTPQRAQVLTPTLALPELDRLLRAFDAEFEGDGTPQDFAWFPAWSLIVDKRLAEATKLAQRGADKQPERCTRIVLTLLTLERQGRHAELVEARRKLREARPELFARYMQDR